MATQLRQPQPTLDKLAKSHVCSQCQPVKLYGSSDALRRHNKTHLGGAQPSWQCPKCNKAPFSRKEYLTRHDKEKHTGEHLGECDLCLRSFPNRYLKEHKKSCKSRTFGQETEPPNKRARVVELQWQQPTFDSPSLQIAGENAAKVPEQAPRLNFVRGYVAPVFRQKKVKSWDKQEAVAASGSSTQEQAVVSTALEPLELSLKQRTEIHLAIKADDIVLFTKIIGSYGDSQDTLLSVNEAYFDFDGSLLHSAAGFGNVSVARLLLSAGIDINSVNKYHQTPLHRAAQYKQVEMIRFLLQRGAHVDAKDCDGCTALFPLCSSSFPEYESSNALESANLLLEHGASIDTEDKWNATALCLIDSDGMNLVVKRLLQAGASVNGSSKEGSPTPLMGACYFSASPIVHTLLDHGADVNMCQWRPWHSDPLDLLEYGFFGWEEEVGSGQIKSRWTALAYACGPNGTEQEMKEMSSRLIAAGADLNLGDVVPLEIAIIYGYPSVIKILLDAGADPSRVPDACIETLQGLHELGDSREACGCPWSYRERKEKWKLLQQYYPDMFGDKECLDSDSEREVSEEDENDEDIEDDQQGSNDRDNEAATIDLIMV